MKRLLLALLCIMAAIPTVCAQNCLDTPIKIKEKSGDFTIGPFFDVHAGVSLTSLCIGKKDERLSGERAGFVAGVGAEVPFRDGWGYISFHPSLDFVLKRARNLLDYGQNTTFGRIYNACCVETSFCFRYNQKFGPNGRLFFGLGPAFSLGVCGKTGGENTFNTARRFNLGLRGSMGYRHKRYFAELGGSGGFLNDIDKKVVGGRNGFATVTIVIGRSF